MDKYQITNGDESDERLEVGILKSKDLGRDRYGDNYRFQTYFGNPFFTLSMTNRKSMEFYDCKSLSIPRCTKSLEEFNEQVNHIIQWNENVFLACSGDSKIKSFHLRGNYSLQKMFLSNRSPVLRLLKLDGDRFMSVNSEGRLFIFNYYTRRMEKELTSQNVGENVTLIRSKMMENCFFINTREKDHDVIKLINYETDTVEKEFVLQKKRVCVIDSYLTFHEILVSMNDDQTIDFFNCNHKLLPSLPSYTDVSRRLLIKEIRISSPITSHSFLKNRYLCVGDETGLVHLISLESYDEFTEREDNDDFKKNDFKKDRLEKEEEEEEEDCNFMDVLQAPVSNGRVDGLVVLSCTQKSTKIAVLSKENLSNRRTNTWISILEMKNLWLFKKGEKKMAHQDLLERSHFVSHGMSSMFWEEEEEKEEEEIISEEDDDGESDEDDFRRVKQLPSSFSSFISFRFLNNKTIDNVLKTFMLI